jgi:hypothetical protein
MNTLRKLVVAVLLLAASYSSFSQTDTGKIYKVGIFANLFLDSSFNGSQYKYSNQMPRYLLPGLDFVQGVLLGIDSLKSTQKIEIKIFDLRSASQNISKLKSQNGFDSLDLMIAAASGTEYRQIADIAAQKNIPFVSATYPNDGGVTNNSFTVIVNPTLPVHCQALYNFIMRSNPTANIIYVRKKGPVEERLAGYFDQYNKGTSGNQLLKWKSILLTDSFEIDEIKTNLDTGKTNLIICGSLDERFGLKVATAANSLLGSYEMEVIGMPTWDAIKDFTKTEFQELPIYYSTAFYNTGTVKWNSFTKTFSSVTNGRPSDIAYKGYEISWCFIQLLLKHKQALMQNLNDKSYRLFTDYDFKPVINTTTGKPDYFENKKIYILKRSSGTVSRMN